MRRLILAAPAAAAMLAAPMAAQARWADHGVIGAAIRRGMAVPGASTLAIAGGGMAVIGAGGHCRF